MKTQRLRHGERGSALWGSGTRGGDSRGSALWGKGGRRAGTTLIGAAFAAIVLSFGASAPASADSTTPPPPPSSTYISADLLSQAQDHQDDRFNVIVQSQDGTADGLAHQLGAWAAQADKRWQSLAAKANADLSSAQKNANSRQTDWAAKAARARLTGKKGDRDAAALAAQLLAKAQAWLSQASAEATAANADLQQTSDQITQNQVTDQFDAIGGVSATLTGRQLTQIYASGAKDVLSITPDAPTTASGSSHWSSDQVWPYASGVAANWVRDGNDSGVQANAPAIAVVDSGIQNRADFGSRLVASVNLSTLPNNSQGDGRGHGTFVAGVAADSAPDYTGASPISKLVSIDVMDDSGMGLTSDVIRACQWILDHQAQYNIRVANFSLHSAITAPFFIDPLDRAVEQLWFHGITVVVAAGNYGTAGGPSGVLYSPSDDPFVITVGAADLGASPKISDDGIAPWSAWGYTVDGFAKPELSAPGRYMIGPVPGGATLVGERPASVTAPGYMQLSGTSFAAPVVAGVAADILARHPDFTPDQVKGALMATARDVPLAPGLSAGVGEVTADDAANVQDTPNPNAALDRFVRGGKRFDAFRWLTTVITNRSWDTVSWNSVSWNDASWNSASWNDASWNDASWNDASWNDVSWNSASWNDASWNDVAAKEDAAEGDAGGDPATAMLSPSDVAALFEDPSLAPDPSTLPDALVPRSPTTTAVSPSATSLATTVAATTTTTTSTTVASTGNAAAATSPSPIATTATTTTKSSVP